jgi:hypothetical protein
MREKEKITGAMVIPEVEEDARRAHMSPMQANKTEKQRDKSVGGRDLFHHCTNNYSSDLYLFFPPSNNSMAGIRINK